MVQPQREQQLHNGDRSGVDQRVKGDVLVVGDTGHGVEGGPGGLHLGFVEHGVKAVVLQGHGQIDDLGDALNGEPPLPMAAVVRLPADGFHADPQLPAVRLAQLGDVAGYLPLSGVGFAKFQRLLQQGLIHNKHVLSLSRTRSGGGSAGQNDRSF